MSTDPAPTAEERHAAGLAKMAEVYGWDDIVDGPGDFFAMTVDHLFGDVWQREGLSVRDRRLLVIGLMMGSGDLDVVDLQLGAGLQVGDLSEHDARELVIFLTHYIGWPRGAKLNTLVEQHLARRARQG